MGPCCTYHLPMNYEIYMHLSNYVSKLIKFTKFTNSLIIFLHLYIYVCTNPRSSNKLLIKTILRNIDLTFIICTKFTTFG